jgi:hypothetical protein
MEDVADQAVIQAYADCVHRDMPGFAQACEQLLEIREGASVALKRFDVDGEYTIEDFAYGEGDVIPRKYVAISRNSGDRADSIGSRPFAHLAMLADVFGPDFPWYKPGGPPGFVVAGSFSTPNFGPVRSVGVKTFDGCEKKLALVPGRGDVDLFLVSGVRGQEFAEFNAKSAERLVRKLITARPSNPFRKFVHPDASCGQIHDYYGKHVVAFTLYTDGSSDLQVQCVTRLYDRPEQVPALFDLQLDGFVFAPSIGVLALDAAMYMLHHRAVVVTPFSGSSTKETRLLKKVIRYGYDLVVPGLGSGAEADSGLGVIKDALTCLTAYKKLRSDGVVSRDASKAIRALLGSSADRRLCAFVRQAYVKWMTDPKKVVEMIMGPSDGGYSFVQGCKGIVITPESEKRKLILLIDDPEHAGSRAGAFSYERPAQFAEAMCMTFDGVNKREYDDMLTERFEEMSFAKRQRV